jgi:hypothetical protein
MKTIEGTLSELREFVRDRLPKEPVLLVSGKTQLPLGAYVPDGRSGGAIFSRRSILKDWPPTHNYGGSLAAYELLKRSVLTAQK